MHPYSVNDGRKIKVYVTIFFVILTSLLYSFFQYIGILDILEKLENSFDMLSPLIDWGFVSIVITPMVIFGFFYFLFNTYIWKWKVVNKIIGIPNVNGEYKGLLISSYINKETGLKIDPIEMVLIVNQTFESIKFISKFPNSPSTSVSNMGGLMSCENGIAEFIFAYSNKSRDITIENDRHEGMNILRFDLKNGIVEGEYFNNRGEKPNKGNVELEKSESI